MVLDHAIHTYLRSRWIVPSFVSILEYVYTVIDILVRHGMLEVYGNIMKCRILYLLPVFIGRILYWNTVCLQQ